MDSIYNGIMDFFDPPPARSRSRSTARSTTSGLYRRRKPPYAHRRISSGESDSADSFGSPEFDIYRVTPTNIKGRYPKTYTFLLKYYPEMSDNQKSQKINKYIGTFGHSMHKLHDGTLISKNLIKGTVSADDKLKLEINYIDGYLSTAFDTAHKKKGQKNKKKKSRKHKKKKKTMRR